MDRFREKEEKEEKEMTENIIAILDNGINHFGRYVKIYDPSKECPTLDTRCDRGPKFLFIDESINI